MKIRSTNQDTKEMRPRFLKALNEIDEVFDRNKPITDITRLASNVMTAYSRIKSTEVHDKALEIMLARKDIKAIELTEE